MICGLVMSGGQSSEILAGAFRSRQERLSVTTFWKGTVTITPTQKRRCYEADHCKIPDTNELQ